MTPAPQQFKMHQNLLYDVITKQAGTLQKSILEGVMNSCDSGATFCDVTLDTHSFSVCDDGCGFQSMEEIEQLFKTFGTPHEAGDAVYGRFRMGRGQMMAYGRNVWRSRRFEMHVDIKERGIDWDLIEHDDDFTGTRVDVDLYEPVLPSDLERIKAELRRFVAWVDIPVRLNGETISQSPENGKWTYEDDNAYYALSGERSQMTIYNLGVMVNSFWSGRFGIGGTIVSKKQLDVNFARNDVQSTCPVFKAISAHIRKEANTGARKKARLTDAQRDMLVRDYLSGDLALKDACKLRAITDVSGRSWPIDKLVQISHQFCGRMVVGTRGDQMIETAQARKIAFSIDQGTLERFGANDAETFLARIAEGARNLLKTQDHGHDTWTERRRLNTLALRETQGIEIVDRGYLYNFIRDDYIALKPAEMTPDHKVILYSIERGYQQMIQALNRSGYEDRTFTLRHLRLGKSDTAMAWTDGTATIWIDEKHARDLRRGYPGAWQIATTLLHEMLHEGPDTGTHQHDFQFYSAFHDMTSLPLDPLGKCAEAMVKAFISQLKQHKRKLSAKLLRGDDAEIALDAIRAEIGQKQDTSGAKTRDGTEKAQDA